MLKTEDQNSLESKEPLEENPLKDAITSRIRRWKSYWITRNAVRSGVHVYDLTREQLQENNFLGPWTFNLYESFLVSIPTIVVFKIIGLIISFDEGIKRIESISSWVEPVSIPLFLTLLSYVAARGSLKRKDIDRDKLERARNAYLYLDGAYGIVSQALMVLGYAIKTHMQIGAIQHYTGLYHIALVFIIIGLLHNFYILFYIVPQELFVINGYDPGKFDHKKDSPPDSAPYRRFGRVVFWGFGALGTVYSVAWVIVGYIVFF